MSLILQVNIILISSTIKKTIELSFCSRLKNNALMVSTVTFAFKIIGPIISSGVKKVSFSRWRKVSLIKGVFPQPRKLSLIKEVFHKQEDFPKKMFDQANYPQKQFTLIKEIFHKEGSFPKKIIFNSSKKFSTVKILFQK